VWLRIYFDGLEFAAAAGAVRKAAEPLDEERVTGKGAGSLKIAAALRTSAQDRMASNGLALLIGNLENEIACSVFTDQVTSHSRQPPQSKTGKAQRELASRVNLCLIGKINYNVISCRQEERQYK
jgi:hypothetical protein